MEKERILVIVPIAASAATGYMDGIKAEVQSCMFSDYDVDYVALSEESTPFIESRAAEYLNTKSIIEKSLEAAAEGYKGIFISCFGEPGVSVVRELIDIPVVGGFIPSITTVMNIAQLFSIVTVVDSVVPMLNTLARDMGIESNLVSIRNVGIPVAELADLEKLKKAALEQSLIAIKEGAEAIVLGCTGMLGLNVWLQQAIAHELNGVIIPVIAPNEAAIGALQVLVKSKLTQSRLTYFKVDNLF